jgi:hypothetical protein
MKLTKIQSKKKGYAKITFQNKVTNLNNITKMQSSISQGLSKLRLP